MAENRLKRKFLENPGTSYGQQAANIGSYIAKQPGDTVDLLLSGVDKVRDTFGASSSGMKLNPTQKANTKQDLINAASRGIGHVADTRQNLINMTSQSMTDMFGESPNNQTGKPVTNDSPPITEQKAVNPTIGSPALNNGGYEQTPGGLPVRQAGAGGEIQFTNPDQSGFGTMDFGNLDQNKIMADKMRKGGGTLNTGFNTDNYIQGIRADAVMKIGEMVRSGQMSAEEGRARMAQAQQGADYQPSQGQIGNPLQGLIDQAMKVPTGDMTISEYGATRKGAKQAKDMLGIALDQQNQQQGNLFNQQQYQDQLQQQDLQNQFAERDLAVKERPSQQKTSYKLDESTGQLYATRGGAADEAYNRQQAEKVQTSQFRKQALQKNPKMKEEDIINLYEKYKAKRAGA